MKFPTKNDRPYANVIQYEIRDKSIGPYKWYGFKEDNN